MVWVGFLLVSLSSCDFSEEERRFVHGHPFTLRYSAADSTGAEVVFGSMTMKVDRVGYGCTTSKCGDVNGSWDFVPVVRPPLGSHPVGTGKIDGILSSDFWIRLTVGPDTRGMRVRIEFPAPFESETYGMWQSVSGSEHGTVVLRDEE